MRSQVLVARDQGMVTARFFDESSCLELAYAELRAGPRSRRVRMREIDRSLWGVGYYGTSGS